jgi:putative phosphoesterase
MKQNNTPTSDTHRIGVISDTHGMVRPEALNALRGVQMIIHAGDVGAPSVLVALRSVAPVVAVRGNMDKGYWADGLPRREIIEVGSSLIYVLHDIHDIDLDPSVSGIAAVISGHSHRPSLKMSEGVMFLNPGSAGPRRFTLPVSVARLSIKGAELSAEIEKLKI